MAAEEQIRRTIAQFAQYLDERRFAEWGELFTQDGVFQHLTGRGAILAFMRGGELATMPDLFRKHVTTNLVITLGEDAAHVESDLVLHERLGQQAWILRMGKYIDDMVPGPGGRWLFARRQLEWTANGLDKWAAGQGD
jgi:hypothetical protein